MPPRAKPAATSGLLALSVEELRDRLRKLGQSTVGGRTQLLERYICHDDEAWEAADRELAAKQEELILPAWLHVDELPQPVQEQQDEEYHAAEDADMDAQGYPEGDGEVEEDDEEAERRRREKKEKKEKKRLKKEKKHKREKDDRPDESDDEDLRMMAEKVRRGREEEEARSKPVEDSATAHTEVFGQNVNEALEDVEEPPEKRARKEDKKEKKEKKDKKEKKHKHKKDKHDDDSSDGKEHEQEEKAPDNDGDEDMLPVSLLVEDAEEQAEAVPTRELDDDMPLGDVLADLEQQSPAQDEFDKLLQEEQEQEQGPALPVGPAPLIADDVNILPLAAEDTTKVGERLPLRRQDAALLLKARTKDLPSNYVCIAKCTGSPMQVIKPDDMNEPSSAVLHASSSAKRRRAAALIRLVVEEKANNGQVSVDPRQRHADMTVIRLPDGTNPDVWHEVADNCHVMMFRVSEDTKPQQEDAAVDVDQVWANTWLEVRYSERWFDCKFVCRKDDELATVQVWGSEVDVAISDLRLKPDLPPVEPVSVVLFGSRKNRAKLHLHMIKEIQSRVPDHDFGYNAACALAEDGEWGTWTKSYDSYLASLLENRLDKVLVPACGCSLNFLVDGNMRTAHAYGTREERKCTEAVLAAFYSVMKLSHQVGTIGRSTFPDNLMNFASTIDIPHNAVPVVRNRKKVLNRVENEFGVIVIPIREDIAQVGDTVTFSRSGKTCVGEVMESLEEAGSWKIKSRNDVLEVQKLDVTLYKDKATFLVIGFNEEKRECARVKLMLEAEDAGDANIFGNDLARPLSDNPAPTTEFFVISDEQKSEFNSVEATYAARRVSKAAHCSVSLVPRDKCYVVVRGNGEQRALVKTLLPFALSQRGNTLAEMKVSSGLADEKGFKRIRLSLEEKGGLDDDMLKTLEMQTKTFMCVRDVAHGVTLSFDEDIQAKIDDAWVSAKFVRKVPMKDKVVRVKLGDGREEAIPITDVRRKADYGLGAEILYAGICVDQEGETGPQMLEALLLEKVRSQIQWGTFRESGGSQRGNFWSHSGTGYQQRGEKGKDGREGKGKDGKGRGWKGRDGKGKDGKGKDGKGKDGKGKEGRGKDGKGKYGKGKDGKGKDGKGKDGNSQRNGDNGGTNTPGLAPPGTPAGLLTPKGVPGTPGGGLRTPTAVPSTPVTVGVPGTPKPGAAPRTPAGLVT
eukprot:TRINITY_DN2296_c0_g3_i1.p1 TRINITY_DN2296_c0_g3~~TRINITY_DN2296_c0_g3_i1.p1  ORF type:complete len:1190 (-),score=212.59 TRINITY_DN2296_c0_g3_i1:166-3735(-)